MTSAIITNTFFQRMALLSLQTLVQVSIDFFFRLSWWMLSSDIISTYRFKMQRSSQRKWNLVQTKIFRFHTHFGPEGPSWRRTGNTGRNY